MIEIRRLEPAAWAVYREVRLAALADSPGAFGATLEEASRRTDGDWQACLVDRVNFVAFDGTDAVGLVSGLAGERPRRAQLISMWVAPAHRRRALGQRLVHEVVSWAREQGYRELALTVVDDNEDAQALYRRLGFAPTGATFPYPNDPRRWEIELSLPLTTQP